MTPTEHAKAIEDAANRLISLAAGICTEGQALAARRALQAAIRAGVGAVPEGWQLVPVEPTNAMLDAMEESGWTEGNYRAVLAAAPKP